MLFVLLKYFVFMIKADNVKCRYYLMEVWL